jgi:hypothetical protein
LVGFQDAFCFGWPIKGAAGLTVKVKAADPERGVFLREDRHRTARGAGRQPAVVLEVGARGDVDRLQDLPAAGRVQRRVGGDEARDERTPGAGVAPRVAAEARVSFT